MGTVGRIVMNGWRWRGPLVVCVSPPSTHSATCARACERTNVTHPDPRAFSAAGRTVGSRARAGIRDKSTPSRARSDPAFVAALSSLCPFGLSFRSHLRQYNFFHFSFVVTHHILYVFAGYSLSNNPPPHCLPNNNYYDHHHHHHRYPSYPFLTPIFLLI